MMKPRFKPYNVIQQAFGESTKPVNVLSGSVRAGKSRPLVERCLSDALRYPGGRFGLVRKTRATLEETTLRSFLVDACGCDTVDDPLTGYGFIKSWNKAKLKGRLINGSEIICIGLDRRAGEREPQKIGSLELTKLYIDEATELAESDMNMLNTRLSYQVRGSTPQTFMATNPGSPQHWLYQRHIAPLGTEADRMLEGENTFVGFLNTFDNPYLDDAYIANLQAMPETSNFYKRLVLGQWIAFLGRVYDAFDEKQHIIETLPQLRDGAFNFRSIDFGGQNPYSCSWYQYDPKRDILYHYRQIYWSGIGDDDFADMIKQHQPDDEPVRYTVSDHDGSGRITLLKYGIKTIAARKDVKRGVDVVNKRLAENKLFFVKTALVERDPKLASEDSIAKRIRPQCTLDEIAGYEWGVDSKGVPTDEPVKKDDHGCDELRYAAMSLERVDIKRLSGLKPRGI